MADTGTPIEAIDCNGALGVVIREKPAVTKGKALAVAIVEAAQKQTPHLVHPEVHLP